MCLRGCARVCARDGRARGLLRPPSAHAPAAGCPRSGLGRPPPRPCPSRWAQEKVRAGVRRLKGPGHLLAPPITVSGPHWSQTGHLALPPLKDSVIFASPSGSGGFELLRFVSQTAAPPFPWEPRVKPNRRTGAGLAQGFVALGELLHLSVSFCLVSLELDGGHVCGARHGCLTCVRASPPLLCMRPVTTTRDSPSHPQPPLTSPQSGGQRRPAQQ